jgi:ribosome-associated protein
MKFPHLHNRDFTGELEISATRSSGPGGQNVNKVSSRIELRFNVDNSLLLTDGEKHILKKKLKTRITESGDLIITSQESRSQLKNKEQAIEKFHMILNKSLTPAKKRLPTKATRASRLKRKEVKQKKSVKKSLRKNITPED